MRKCTCNKKIIKPKGFLAYIKKKFHQLIDFRLNYVVFNRINLQLRLLPNNTSLIKLLNLVLLYSGHIPVYSIMDKDTAKFKCIYFSKLTEEIPSYHNI